MTGTPIPLPFRSVDRVIHDKHAAYDAKRSGDRHKPRREYLNSAARARSLEAYLSREFVSWDGEGVNNADGSHSYVLLASSDGAYMSNQGGLPTADVLELFLNAREGVTHIGYGLGYDINMILRDLDRESLTFLYHTGKVRWNGYRIAWRPGKSFAVRTRERRFLIYDILPFFQRSFVAACDEFLQDDSLWQSVRDQVIREKANRGRFAYEQLGDISDYNNAELATLVRLANELRERLYRASIRVRRWDGPGAIASALYQKHGTKPSIAPTPNPVATASRHAYAGGRFEIIRTGHSDGRCYQYDLRSAYPSALRHLPCLSHGHWRHVIRPTDIVRFGVYRIELTKPVTDHPTQPQPLWMRNKDGTVGFGEHVHGWYWSPEAALVTGKDGVVIHEGWEYHSDCECEPFGFVEPLYLKRAALKRAGDGAHVAYKLGLNSLYGKLAQQVGWDPGPPLKIPPYHCLEWAGYVTSHCRAQVYRASLLAPDDILSFETDAVFSRVPLDLDIGSDLGQWDETEYTSLTYLKSGIWWGTLPDGTEVEKTRGINKGSLPRMAVITALQHETPTVTAETTRFVTLGQALHQNFDIWTHWVTAPRVIQVSLAGKRVDVLDKDHVRKDLSDGWWETVPGWDTRETEFSYPYEIEWVSGSTVRHPDGWTLSELRDLDDENGWGIDYD